MSLKFIQAGTHAVAGSTCTSYGSISPPLIAADFLGYAFWNNVKEGLPAGEALRRAKITLAREMHNRQGYLDGEDQKTLISFILYGDPMAVPAGIQVKAKSVLRSVKPPSNLKTVCDRSHEQGEPEPVPDDIQEFVKSVVRQYLPGMEDARLSMSLEHVDCGTNHPIRHSEGSHSQKRPDSASARPGFQLARKVITLSKEVPNRVMYCPFSVVVHQEGVSSGKSLTEGMKRFQGINRETFTTKWSQDLMMQFAPDAGNAVAACERGLTGNILVIDPFMPMFDRASGSLRLFTIIRLLRERGLHVTYVARNGIRQERYVRTLQRMGVEVYATDPDKLAELGYVAEAQRVDLRRILSRRSYQVAWLSFFEIGEQYLHEIRCLSPGTKIVIDTVDIHTPA